MSQNYYHITSFESYHQSIKHDGLHAGEEGYIYLLTRKDISGYVAVNQLGIMDSFALLEIFPEGIHADIEPDRVAEFTAEWQVRVKQDFIDAEFIEIEDMYHVKLKGPYHAEKESDV